MPASPPRLQCGTGLTLPFVTSGLVGHRDNSEFRTPVFTCRIENERQLLVTLFSSTLGRLQSRHSYLNLVRRYRSHDYADVISRAPQVSAQCISYMQRYVRMRGYRIPLITLQVRTGEESNEMNHAAWNEDCFMFDADSCD
jgi:hypothetical protein